MTFKVIDLLTNEDPNLYTIALYEGWTENLCYTDVSGFMLDEDGILYLADDCNNIAACPNDRFKITIFINEKEIHSYIY